MVGTVCETVKLSLKPAGFTAEVAGIGQSLEAAGAAICGNHELVLRRAAAKANGRMNAGWFTAEVRRV